MITYIVVNSATDEVRIASVLSEEVARNSETLLAEATRVAEMLNMEYDTASWSGRIIDTSELPGNDPNGFDKTFRGAYTDRLPGNQIDVDLPKAKTIAHEKRRIRRGMLFAPHDQVIARQIPTEVEVAEAARNIIRADDAAVQNEIDGALTADDLESILLGYGAPL